MCGIKNGYQDHRSIGEDVNLPLLIKERKHLCHDKNFVSWVIFKSYVRTNFDTKLNLKQTQTVSKSLKFSQILLEKSSILDIKP